MSCRWQEKAHSNQGNANYGNNEGLPISHQTGKNQKADNIKCSQKCEEVSALLKLLGGSVN